MGKMRLKLSHVMPHVWFYKLREVGKPGTTQFKASDTTRKSAYASPVNHKAIDIPFPSETPKRSPHIERPSSKEFSALDQLHLLELSDECRPSIVLPYTPAPENIMTLSLDEDNPVRISSAPDGNANSPSSGFNFDARELERRLRDLDLEDRRKQHSSPMLLSVSVPSPRLASPMLGGVPHTGTHPQKGLDGYSLDTCGACECTSDVSIADEFRVDMHVPWGGGRKSPLLNVSYASDKRQHDGFVSNGGERLCGSFDESTSSSDTGFERGSSSMWERDVFSITSDGSEAFTATGPDEVEPAHKMRQRLWKLRERMNPSLYGNVHMDNGMSRFYEGNRVVGLTENDTASTFFNNKGVVADVQDVRRPASNAGYEESHMGESLYEASYVRNGMSQIGDVGSSKRGCHYRMERPFSLNDAHQAEEGTSFSSRKHEVGLCRSMQNLPIYDDKDDCFSLPADKNEYLSIQDESGNDQLSMCSRLSTGRFSYARCKERLLSNRTFVEQQVSAARESHEEQTLSNYAKFKLKQSRSLHGKVSASNVGMYLDPGLFNTVSRKDKHSCAYDDVDTDDISLSSDTSRLDQSSKHVLPHRRSTSKLQHIQARDYISSKSNVQDPNERLDMIHHTRLDPPHVGSKARSGSQRLKGTRLRDVKGENPSFEQFSRSTSAGGTPLSTSQSRVFDSIAMVKCSYDPRHDFKESMVEMIKEKGLHSSHDMVELLQCYLSLNADVYHDTIVKVFTEVWSEMFQHI